MVFSLTTSIPPSLLPSIHRHHHHRRQSPPASSSFFLPFPSRPRFLTPRSASAIPGSGVESEDLSVVRRPAVVVAPSPLPGMVSDDDRDGAEERTALWSKKRKKIRIDPECIDLEDEILEETVPIVGFVRMLLHSGTYGSGDRLSPEHQKIIMERLLPHHPEYESKVGCGVDFITIGYHPDFESSRCLFIVRKDKELVDFSYWKCIESLIRKKHPLYVDTFILRHFRGGKYSN